LCGTFKNTFTKTIIGMAENKITLKTISELLRYSFFIPSYQRGYRWTKQQVEDLLNDIEEFSPKEVKDSEEKTWYCLQPIVVKKYTEKMKQEFNLNNSKEWFEVIDGQQRLTTIYLLIHYINKMWKGKQKLEEFTLSYQTRPNSEKFLKEIKIDETTDSLDTAEDNIDFHFISNAYITIHEWVKKRKLIDTGSFESKFAHSTKVIWYETADTDSIDIFTRINMGKIPLTNAELIKALFLNSSNFGYLDSEKLRLKQLEIASEWDRMEFTLQDDSFWYFINKEANNLATRIEFIFDLMAEKETKPDPYSTFRYFNEKFKGKIDDEISNNWQEIKKYYQTLEEWFNDRILYHKIGYLITVGFSIKSLLKEKKDKSKTEFKNWLNKQIEDKIQGIDTSTIEYGNPNLRNVLLLHNIQTMLKNEDETNRFPFDRYKKEYWDVEHIHAIATEVKVKKENQIEWLKNNFVKTEIHDNEEKNKQIENIINSKEPIDENEFSSFVEYILGEEDNTLRNLCLLDRGTNRSYKNDGFKEKRNKIIEREIEGTFIPTCTKNVFMKYYSPDVKDIEIWNESDRESYRNKIKESLKLS